MGFSVRYHMLKRHITCVWHEKKNNKFTISSWKILVEDSEKVETDRQTNKLTDMYTDRQTD